MTAPNPITVTIPANLGMSMEMVVLLVLVVLSMVLFAKDVKIGLISLFVTLALNVVVLFEHGFNYTPALIVFFMVVVMLAFTLYASATKSRAPGGYMT